jgi:hypothetical protein
MQVSPRSGILAGRWFAVATVIATMGVSLVACNREKQATGEGRSPGDETPAADRVEPEAAVNSMSEARCEYEQRCGNVGQDRTYSDKDHCLTRFKGDFQKELNAWECPGGINRDELTECLTEIRNNDCNSPFDSLERVIACRSSDLCEGTRR